MMKRFIVYLLTFFVSISIFAGNVITYTASKKLPRTNNGNGIHSKAFNVHIKSHQFANGIGTITFSGEVTEIGMEAFYGCSDMTSVNIPNSVKKLGYHAFYGCSGLTSITIPNSITEIVNDAFESCTGLTAVHISDLSAWCDINFHTSYSSPLYYATHLYLNGQKVENAEISTIHPKISDHAFENCADLVSIKLPSSITHIGYLAFKGCKNLKSVTLPSKLKTISYKAFEGCINLTDITIPSSVTKIESYAFNGCVRLKEITIPSSITSIEDKTFNKCFRLEKVVIPNSVTSIGKYAFANCPHLSNIAIPYSVTDIGEGAFSGFNVEEITLPYGIKNISEKTFEYTSKLKRIYVPMSQLEYYKSKFKDTDVSILPIEISGSIEITNIEYDVLENGIKGMKIHSNISVKGWAGNKVSYDVFFYKGDNGTGGKLISVLPKSNYKAAGGQVYTSKNGSSIYNHSTWDDWTLFIPYEEFPHNAGQNKYSLRAYVRKTGEYNWETIASTPYKNFQINFPKDGSKIRLNIEKIWQEQNVDINGVKSLVIHVKMNGYGLKGMTGQVVAYIDSPEGVPVKTNNTKYQALHNNFAKSIKWTNEKYIEVSWDDLKISIPNSDLPNDGTGKDYYIRVQAYVDNTDIRSNLSNFVSYHFEKKESQQKNLANNSGNSSQAASSQNNNSGPSRYITTKTETAMGTVESIYDTWTGVSTVHSVTTCVCCHGTGRCGICNGMGGAWIGYGYNSRWITCTGCAGTTICSFCGGQGKKEDWQTYYSSTPVQNNNNYNSGHNQEDSHKHNNSSDHGYKDCPNCINGVCSACNGKGYINAGTYTGKNDLTPCPCCNGHLPNGLGDGKCSSCNGTGQIYGIIGR